jgi:hypothetical protein
LHAPEVECIAKGKARTRYEFGVKVPIAVTNARAAGGLFWLGIQALPGLPYDGHQSDRRCGRKRPSVEVAPELELLVRRERAGG